jgi:hypothetical protein
VRASRDEKTCYDTKNDRIYMKRIKKYAKVKEKPPRQPKPMLIQLETRYGQGVTKLFSAHPDLLEVEAEILSPFNGNIYFFHERFLRAIYDQYRVGEIDIQYLRKWFKLLFLIRKQIGVVKGNGRFEDTMRELLMLTKENRLTRKNFLSATNKLFRHIDQRSKGVLINLETGEIFTPEYEQDSRMIKLAPDENTKRRKKKTD